MRRVITVSGGRFDLDSVRPKIESIVLNFDKYLDEYPLKTARSKHGVMGPVAKILERAQTRKWDPPALTGYALRMHEMNPKARGFLSPIARQALEEGTAQLVALCREVPVTAVAKVVERIDYGLYYVRRKKGIEKLDNTRLMFVRFLQGKYGDDFGKLMDAWGEKDVKATRTFDEIRYPSKMGETYKKFGAARKKDVDEFWEQSADQAAQEEEEENGNV